MSVLNLVRNYKAQLSLPVIASNVGEIEFSLDVNPESDMGFIIVDPGNTSQAKEEFAFYHRRSGNSVFVYGNNRSNPVSHEAGTQVRLASSVDFMNYLSQIGFHQGFVYRKGNDNVVIKGGNFFIGSSNWVLPDVDTSLNVEGQKLIPDTPNYVYIRTPENGTPHFSIESDYDPTAYLLAKIEWSLQNSQYVGDITPYRPLGIGTQGPVGTQGEPGVPGDQGEPGPSGTVYVNQTAIVTTDGTAKVVNTGTPSAANLTFHIPRGPKGDTGEGIVWKGGWDNTVQYQPYDAVNDDNSSWICVLANTNVRPSKQTENYWRYLAMKGKDGDALAPPAEGNTQTIEDNTVLPAGASGTTDGSTYVKITYADASYDNYTLTGIYKYYSDGTLAASTETVGVWSSGGINYANDGIFINATTFAVSYSGKPAYKNIQNVFEKTNTFNEDVIFKKRVSYPFNDLGLKTGNFNFNGNAGVNQKVTIGGGSNHVCYLGNMTPGVYVLYVYQNSNSGGIVFQNVAGGGGFTENPHIIGGSFVNDGTAAATAGAHIFTVMSSGIAAHVTYVGKSVST